MSPLILLLFVFSYFVVLVGISFLTSRKPADDSSFFLANRNSRWWLVAFGMIGTALSGVTYISVPGKVGAPTGDEFSYFQFILGNAAGFVIIRFYLVILVLQKFIFDHYHIPFILTAIICLALIWSYTFRGGLKTIIITDSLQTFFLILAVFLSIYFICKSLHYDAATAVSSVADSHYSRIFFFQDLVPAICLISPLFCLYLNAYSKSWLGGYIFDNELIIVNGGLTFLLLLISSKRCPSTSTP